MYRFLLFITIGIALLACGSSEQNSLDKSIPRLQSPVDQIEYLRTKWRDGKHIETVFFDSRDRVLEKFNFGRSSLKEQHFYEGNFQKKSVYYSHSDSSEPGYVSVDTVTREFDSKGRLILESHVTGSLSDAGYKSTNQDYKRHLSYAMNGDTTFRLENQFDDDYTPLANIDQWERDKNNRLKRHYRLYVMHSQEPAQPDTTYDYSQRFSYDNKGRLKLAWFDKIYLGKFYLVPGPDSIWYTYNSRNQLLEERHIYSNEMRNKREIDTTRLTSQDRESVRHYR
jgi:hypothetical protein